MAISNGASYHQDSVASEQSETIEVPVLVVGGGPTGLVQARLLSKLGVKSLIVEKYPERLGALKALALSPGSLEICRQFGLDVAKIRQMGTKRADAYWMDVDVLEYTPEMIHNIPQPQFEQFVTDELATDNNIDVQKGVGFVSLSQVSGFLFGGPRPQNSSTLEQWNDHTIVEERATGHRFSIRSQHVIACDGARSYVREFLGIESEGEDSYETMMTIHFQADLRPIVGPRVGMLHWLMDSLVAGFIIAYDLSGNAVLISNFDGDKYAVETWNESLCFEVVRCSIGKDIPLRIHSYRPWLLSRKVANSYRMGNVFLAGDAAHSFPPTGGLGLNSGLANVHNLAYKIAAVHQGWATDSILDTYESERRHVAMVNSQQSVKNGKKIFGLLKMLGTGGTNDLQNARRNLLATINDPAKQSMIQDGIEGQREHFDNLELHIGYVYNSPSIAPNASLHTRKFIPEARLPHTWITAPSSTTCHLPPISTSYIIEFHPPKSRYTNTAPSTSSPPTHSLSSSTPPLHISGRQRIE